MDELEKFVRSSRDSFDDKAPDSLKMWSRIESRLPKSQATVRRFQTKRILGIAASFIVLCLVGAVVFQSIQINQMSQTQESNEELVDINKYYTQLISHKVQQVQSSNRLSDADKIEYLQYFDELERESKRLEKDLELNIDNELVLGAIVENYRQRLNLLENLLNRLHRSKEKENEKSISI